MGAYVYMSTFYMSALYILPNTCATERTLQCVTTALCPACRPTRLYNFHRRLHDDVTSELRTHVSINEAAYHRTERTLMVVPRTPVTEGPRHPTMVPSRFTKFRWDSGSYPPLSYQTCSTTSRQTFPDPFIGRVTSSESHNVFNT